MWGNGKESGNYSIEDLGLKVEGLTEQVHVSGYYMEYKGLKNTKSPWPPRKVHNESV